MIKYFISLILFVNNGTLMAVAENPSKGAASPVLVELFTSEGCSTCPPADALLQELDQAPPVAGAQLIVLSEHVDYWNSIGWTDPYSSSFFSDRQNSYGSRFKLASVYTPEMVVDGAAEFVGGDRRLANQSFEKAREHEKIPVHISSVSWEDASTLRAHVEAGPLPISAGVRRAEVYLVAALDHAESQVLRGENKGRRLTHVAVVLSMTKIGTTEKGKGFAGDAHIKLDARRNLAQLRVVAFVQESGPGRVLGAAIERITK
jgi:hypothetical protein